MIYTGNALDVLCQLDAESVQCCVTSPPYWGLRDYGIPPSAWGGDPSCLHNGTRPFCKCGAWIGVLGLEPDPGLYVAHITMLFREVLRVLKTDGTLWLNLGDCYATGGGKVGTCPGGGSQGERWAGYRGNHGRDPKSSAIGPMTQPNRMPLPGLKPKDLVGIPWRVAFALQADGWYLRSDIIWHKPNPMPESVTDRPTKAHEYLFLLSKAERYHYDADAIKEPCVGRNHHDRTGTGYLAPGQTAQTGNRKVPAGWKTGRGRHDTLGGRYSSGNKRRLLAGVRESGQTRGRLNTHLGSSVPWTDETGLRNCRTVWTLPTKPYKGAHFATFPTRLVEPCILAGCPEGETVLDPFAGTATVGLVAREHGRKFIGIELNPEYVKLAHERLNTVTASTAK